MINLILLFSRGRNMNWLIVVAGGKGERTNLKFNKIFARLKNYPLLYWTLRTFEKSKIIDQIIISAKEKDIKKIKSIIKKYKFKKIKDVIKSTHLRQDSTFTVLKSIRPKIKKNDLVGVHNAVNPFVREDEIEKVYSAAKRHKAALLAFPARDTVKITNKNGLVNNTPLRQYCFYAQTPKVAPFKNLYKAHLEAHQKHFAGTDDAQLLERIGIKPKVIICSHQNIKITFPEDLLLARQILKNFK